MEIETIIKLGFLAIIMSILYAIFQPIIKEYDKRKAEDRLAKKIAKEMLDEKEKRENQKEDI